MKTTADPFDLCRFTHAQEGVYDRALSELKRGRKQGHWMWYIFPQLAGLGYSETTRYYAIKSREEAVAYMNHPVLGPRLVACAKTVLRHKGRPVSEIFGYPDDVAVIHDSFCCCVRAGLGICSRVDAVLQRVSG